jgi:hypothetical protein
LPSEVIPPQYITQILSNKMPNIILAAAKIESYLELRVLVIKNVGFT